MTGVSAVFQVQPHPWTRGFGIVFLAWDPALRRHVALKVPQPEALVTPEGKESGFSVRPMPRQDSTCPNISSSP